MAAVGLNWCVQTMELMGEGHPAVSVGLRLVEQVVFTAAEDIKAQHPGILRKTHQHFLCGGGGVIPETGQRAIGAVAALEFNGGQRVAHLVHGVSDGVCHIQVLVGALSGLAQINVGAADETAILIIRLPELAHAQREVEDPGFTCAVDVDKEGRVVDTGFLGIAFQNVDILGIVGPQEPSEIQMECNSPFLSRGAEGGDKGSRVGQGEGVPLRENFSGIFLLKPAGEPGEGVFIEHRAVGHPVEHADFIVQLDADDVAAVAVKAGCDDAHDLLVPFAALGQITGIQIIQVVSLGNSAVKAHRHRIRMLFGHPVGDPFLFHLGHDKGARTDEEVEAIVPAEIDEGAQVQLILKAILPLCFLVKQPGHIG